MNMNTNTKSVVVLPKEAVKPITLIASFFGLIAFLMLSYNGVMYIYRALDVTNAMHSTSTDLLFNMAMCLIGAVLLSIIAHIVESGKYFVIED